MSEGQIQMDFVYNCCVAAQVNLLDFFEKWGFLTPVDRSIEDYDTKTLKVTEEMVDELKKKWRIWDMTNCRILLWNIFRTIHGNCIRTSLK